MFSLERGELDKKGAKGKQSTDTTITLPQLQGLDGLWMLEIIYFFQFDLEITVFHPLEVSASDGKKFRLVLKIRCLLENITETLKRCSSLLS